MFFFQGGVAAGRGGLSRAGSRFILGWFWAEMSIFVCRIDFYILFRSFAVAGFGENVCQWRTFFFVCFCEAELPSFFQGGVAAGRGGLSRAEPRFKGY